MLLCYHTVMYNASKIFYFRLFLDYHAVEFILIFRHVLLNFILALQFLLQIKKLKILSV
jgi:hypothetical protein